MFSNAQNPSQWCGDIEGFEFTNGHESIQIQDHATYVFGDLPSHFYLNAHIDGYSESLKYKVENLDTGEIHQITENLLPYTFPAGGNDWNLGTGTFRVTAYLFYLNNAQGWACDVDVITFTITAEEPCLADAGTLTATETNVELSNGEAMISATPNGDANVPSDYSVLYLC